MKAFFIIMRFDERNPAVKESAEKDAQLGYGIEADIDKFLLTSFSRDRAILAMSPFLSE